MNTAAYGLKGLDMVGVNDDVAASVNTAACGLRLLTVLLIGGTAGGTI